MSQFTQYLDGKKSLNEVLTSTDISTSTGSVGSLDNRDELLDAINKMRPKLGKFIVDYLQTNGLLQDVDKNQIIDV